MKTEISENLLGDPAVQRAMTSHTHGPWFYIDSSCPIVEGQTKEGYNFWIAKCEPGYSDATSLETCKANARLIAAAPELLGMLRDGAFQLERLTGENLKVYARTFAALAARAIAKATGEAP